MKRRLRSFALGDLLAVLTVALLAISVAAPSGIRARELSKRLACRANLKNIGAATKIYANDHNGKWMIPPFKMTMISNGGIDYLCNDGTSTPPSADPGEIGFDRETPSTSPTPEYPSAGSEAVSVTRAYWMLVRSGDMPTDLFICPSSSDAPDSPEVADRYFDFTGYANISYGYLVPFGPRDTQPRENMDDRQIVAADKGPYYFHTYTPTWHTSIGRPVRLGDAPREWRPFNSPNHGGTANGEGQNCLYADGRVSFERTPAVGIDHDNIYTVMTNNWAGTQGFNRIHGYAPHEFPGGPPYPGQNAFGTPPTHYSSTDSLIYP